VETSLGDWLVKRVLEPFVGMYLPRIEKERNVGDSFCVPRRHCGLCVDGT
jgi:hypothetical protein